MALNIIAYNPYRIIGVFPTSTRKEIVANIARIKANIRVERTVSFSADLDAYLNSPERTLEDIADAEARLTLPADSIRYAQFWFTNTDELDAIAINNLAAGAFDNALSIWEKKTSVSSIHNRIVAYLLNGNFDKAIPLAYTFYAEYKKEFAELVLGSDSQAVSVDNLDHDFLDVLCDEVGASEISSYVTDKDWREYVINKIVTSVVDSIEHSINVAKQTKGKGCSVRLKAGTKLMSDTRSLLQKLKKEISQSNTKYQIVVDKLGLEILQCGIDYYNGSSDDDAAYKSLKLQKYAQSIVVGKMAKDRCDENVHILEGIISKLPPVEVMPEHKAIQTLLMAFAVQPELIEYSIQLIKDCAPYIVSIKEKIGADHQYYLEISTIIVNNALGKVISEVNEAQKKDFETLKKALIEAWRTQLYMDKFDLEEEYKEGRYKQCREALHGIIEKCHGFDEKIAFLYRGGWCTKLDVTDVDLRTDDEFYASCSSIASYRAYVESFPSGKHIAEANKRIEELAFQNAHTIGELNEFIQQYPQSQYVQEAKVQVVELRFKRCKSISDFQIFIDEFSTSKFVPEARKTLNRLIQEENERKARIAKQDKALAACHSTDDVLELYAQEKSNKIDVNKCSLKAYELAIDEADYRNIIETFGLYTTGGQQAKFKVDDIELEKIRKIENRNKIFKYTLWITIPLLALFVIFLIWGIRGLLVGCSLFAFISWFVAVSSMENRSGGFAILIAIASLFTFSAVGLYNLSGKQELADSQELISRQESKDRIENKKTKELYEKIISSPSEELCKEYIRQFSNTEQADDVRDIWLTMLKSKANSFDYGLDKEETKYISSYPIKNLQEFISDNIGTSYAHMAHSVIESVCDSLYNVAKNNATIQGWKQYQKIVPTDYLRDSESKIQEIRNQAWNTDAKAWKKALSENNIASYEKYKFLYPNGKHISQCEKKLIDLQVSAVYAGDHGSLPEMDRTSYGDGSTSHITVTNSTSYTITLLYSGPDSKRLVVSAHGTSSISLKNGNYRVVASVSASNVGNYAGNETLRGGSYSVDYYISTYRY